MEPIIPGITVVLTSFKESHWILNKNVFYEI